MDSSTTAIRPEVFSPPRDGTTTVSDYESARLPDLTMNDISQTERLPILDIGQFEGPGSDRTAFLADLREAARRTGFFYITGHGISAALIRDLRALAKRFFALPAAEKLSIAMVNSPHFRGYNRAGLEHTRGKPDWREQIDIGPERQVARSEPDAPAWTRLQGPNQWPERLPELKPVVLAYQEAVTALAIKVLRAFAAALEQPEDVFEPIYTPEAHQLLKIIRYPGRSGGDRQGVGAHKDSGFVTILLQDDQAGLQVQREHGWIDAPPIEGTLVVNVGEILELASNGYLRANVHRVVSPAESAERMSIAFFLGARLDATVPVLDLAPELAAQAGGLTQDPMNPLFHDVGRNYLKGRLRSHPDVAQRHHADLLERAPESCSGAAAPVKAA
jgi:isopenicillin N synthase-like dioxygenase